MDGYQWLVSNGQTTFSGTGNAGLDVTVIWNNVQATSNTAAPKGKLEITVSGCSLPSGEDTYNKEDNIVIKTLNGVTPSNITGDGEVAANITSAKTYSVSKVKFPNTGVTSGWTSSVYADSYEWVIPAGWKLDGVTSDGSSPFTGKGESVSLVPDAFSQDIIKVRAYSSCNNGYTSNWSPVKNITRTVATPSNITGNNGNNFVICGDTSPITFQVSTVAGATSYTWTKPAGWGGSSSTNNITLTPNGSNAGTITVKANSGPYTSVASSKTLSIEAIDLNNPPTITGSTTVCTTGSTFILNNVPSQQTVTWAISPSNLVATASGTGTTANISAANPFISGAASITYTVTGCTKTNTFSEPIWVGKPSGVSTNPSGVPAVQASLGSWVVIRVNSTPGASTFSLNWWTNNSFALDLNPGYGNCSVECQQIGYNYVYVTSSNVCGTSPSRQIPINVTSGGGGGQLGPLLMYSPNPVSNELVVSLSSDDVKAQGVIEKGGNYEVILYDSRQKAVYQGVLDKGTLRIDMSDLPKGIYYLTAYSDVELFRGQIIKE